MAALAACEEQQAGSAAVLPAGKVQHICHAHWDGGSSQGGTKHSLPLARRRGGFNSNNQLNSSTER